MKAFISAVALLVAALSLTSLTAFADGGETGGSRSHTQPHWPRYADGGETGSFAELTQPRRYADGGETGGGASHTQPYWGRRAALR